ncbi:MAG: glycosyltransferase family 39 protein [Bacteroidota bacterium]
MSEEKQNPGRYPLGEPSVLDYVKSLLRFGRGERIRIPDGEQPSAVDEQDPATVIEEEAIRRDVIPSTQQKADLQEEHLPLAAASFPFPWRSLLALVLGLIGQQLFEPPPSNTSYGYVFYIVALVFLGWAIQRGEWNLYPLAPHSEGNDPQTYRLLPLIASVVLGIGAFASLGNNFFTLFNVILWLSAVFCFLWAFWLRQPSTGKSTSFFQRGDWTLNTVLWTSILVAATVLVFFFRFYQTQTVPPEPFSDHAEKILDVYDVSQGITHIFFPRNTGREAIQMYWTVLIAKVFGTGLSFLSLKLGTAILGFLTLPFIYLLGREIGGKRVGLFAFVLVGIGYWPNVISRVGLRFPLYPLFVAPTLFYLIRGLRTRNRNDFLLSGLFLGLGLHGYSPFRIVPFVVIAAFVLFWLHDQSRGARRDGVVWLALAGFTSLYVFLPLLRYWVDEPAVFGFRAATRLSGLETPITQPIWKIFLSNVWNALRMFNFNDGQIWVHSVTDRPALDVITAVLFTFGVVLIIVRYARKRHWLDLFLLVSIPLLQLPSTLSLAYPSENPALNRAGGAYIPVFILAALALDGLVTAIGLGMPTFKNSLGRRSIVSIGLLIFLLLGSARQNYDLVFRQYYEAFRAGSWNSSDMGRVINQFKQMYGETDTVWIVPFPYWVDTRLPAVWAGIPNRDMAMWRENLPGTVELPGPKMFLVKANVDDPTANDQDTLDVLQKLYPQGELTLFDSDIPGHDFWVFTVPK